MSKIYRDFDHYWTEGDHPWSSASRDIAEEEWKRFEPTILATRDDYKQMYIELCNDETEKTLDIVTKLFQYMELYKKDDAPKFFRWWSDQI